MNVGVFHSAIVTNKEQTGELEDWAEKAHEQRARLHAMAEHTSSKSCLENDVQTEHRWQHAYPPALSIHASIYQVGSKKNS